VSEEWIEQHEARHLAEQLVMRAERDASFAENVKADPVAYLTRMGVREEVVRQMMERPNQARPRDCADFTCWTSECPGTCYVSF
jgi:hypothetical protein